MGYHHINNKGNHIKIEHYHIKNRNHHIKIKNLEMTVRVERTLPPKRKTCRKRTGFSSIIHVYSILVLLQQAPVKEVYLRV
jgi:hypothetical protein